SLELREPPVRSWVRLERAIKLEERPRAPRSTNWWQPKQLGWLAAAAGLVIATAVGLKYMPTRTQQPAPPAQTANDARAATEAAAANATAQSVEAELRQAEDHYEKAIKGLEQIANAEQDVFDPRTAATLQKNLAVIDQAISESRAALRVEPT